jgi:hypothetical protein
MHICEKCLRFRSYQSFCSLSPLSVTLNRQLLWSYFRVEYHSHHFSFLSNYCRESDQSHANSDDTVSCGYRGNGVYLWKCGESRCNMLLAGDRHLQACQRHGNTSQQISAWQCQPLYVFNEGDAMMLQWQLKIWHSTFTQRKCYYLSYFQSEMRLIFWQHCLLLKQWYSKRNSQYFHLALLHNVIQRQLYFTYLRR